jgi:hypothetical protein
MNAQEIRKTGIQIKSWSTPDGSWYIDHFQIWEVNGKHYQIQDHVGQTLGSTGSKFGIVTEIKNPGPRPTHMGIILGVKKGEAWVEKTFQGDPDSIAEWYDKMVQKLQKDPYKWSNKYFLKITELDFD